MKTPWTHNELVRLACRWAKARGYLVVLAESGHLHGDLIPDVLAWARDYLGQRSILIEVKISRADFRRDKDKPLHTHPEKYPGQERLYCAPQGVLKLDDIPPSWGLLEPTTNGKGLTVRRRGVQAPACERREAEIPYLLAFVRRYQCGVERNVLEERFILPADLAALPADVRAELLAEHEAREGLGAVRATLVDQQEEEQAHRVACGAEPVQVRLFG